MVDTINLKTSSLLRYVGVFLIDYLAIIAITYIFVFYYGYSFSPLFCFIALFLAAYAAAVVFVREQGRAPRDKEQWFLSVLSFLSGAVSTFIISLLYIDYYYLFFVKYQVAVVLQDYRLIVVFFIVFLALFFAYFVINVAFGWAARKYSAKIR